MKLDIWKILLCILWLMVIANPFVTFPSPLATGLYAVGLFLVVAHLGEYLVFRNTIAQRPEGTLLAFVMTFFFGVLYWKDFPSKPWHSE